MAADLILVSNWPRRPADYPVVWAPNRDNDATCAKKWPLIGDYMSARRLRNSSLGGQRSRCIRALALDWIDRTTLSRSTSKSGSKAELTNERPWRRASDHPTAACGK